MSQIKTRNFRRKHFLTLVTLFLFLAVAGFLFLDLYALAVQPDSTSYLVMAGNLFKHGLFHVPGSGNVDLYRTTWYPLFLAAILLVPGAGQNHVLVVQAFSLGLQTFLLYEACRILWNEKIGFRAALLGLMLSATWFGVFALLTETLFTLLLVAAFYTTACFVKKQGRIYPVFGGLLLGIAALTRPIGLPLVFVWGGMLFFLERDRSSWMKRLIPSGLWIASGLFVVFPWMIRNSLVWDKFIVSPIAVWNLGHYQVPAVLSDALGVSLEEARTMVPVLRRGNSPGDVGSYILMLLKHPASSMKTHLAGTISILVDPFISFWVSAAEHELVVFGISALVMKGSFLDVLECVITIFCSEVGLVSSVGILLSTVLLAVIYGFSVVRVLESARTGFRMGDVLPIVILIVLVLVLLPGVVGNGRFRIPAEPFFAVLAAGGMEKFAARLRKKNSLMEIRFGQG